MAIFRFKPPVRYVPKDSARYRPWIIVSVSLFILFDIVLISWALIIRN